MRSRFAYVAIFICFLLTSGCAGFPQKTQVKAENDGQQKMEGSSPCQAKAVTDSTTVEAGEGCTAKGIDDWEGEISGVPVPGSAFTKLQIGMGINQVIALVGTPTDQGSYMTGKAWIPFYFGSDKYRIEYVYKNQGRLIFASGPGFFVNFSNGNLIWIIHNSSEPGHR